MCMFSTPKMPEAPQQRQAARAPDGGDPAMRDRDRNRRRLAMASSIFTSPLGSPATTNTLGA